MAQPPPPPPEFQDAQSRAAAAVAFLGNVKARFRRRPAVYVELCDVLTAYGRDPAAPAAPVLRRTAELLRGHPDLVAEFNAVIYPHNRVELLPAAGDDGDHAAAAARPRRRSDAQRRRPDDAAAAESSAVAAAERRAKVSKAEQFLANLRIVGGVELHDRVEHVIHDVNRDKGLDAHQVYARLEEVLAAEHPYLLHGVDEFFPRPKHQPLPHTAADGEPDADHRPSSSKSKLAAVIDINQNGDATRPSRARATQLRTAAIFDLQINHVDLHVNKNSEAVRPKKKPRAADPQISKSALDGGDDDDGDDDGAVLPSRAAKKPRAADIKIKRRHPLDDGEESDACWQVTTTDNPHDAARTFRKILEFIAWYSKLVTTMRRAEELERREPQPHGALKDLFPSRDCHEILEELYGGGWRTVQVTHGDDGGGRAGCTTLAAMFVGLRQRENAAVELARRRADKTRYGEEPAAASGLRPRRHRP
uniref:Histone deacetylase interacting domain-containing protein n=1 Tax=Oryza barthii TaxID=65489 RepID=A0A0D3HCZ6_9ORYZ